MNKLKLKLKLNSDSKESRGSVSTKESVILPAEQPESPVSGDVGDKKLYTPAKKQFSSRSGFRPQTSGSDIRIHLNDLGSVPSFHCSLVSCFRHVQVHQQFTGVARTFRLTEAQKNEYRVAQH